VVVRVAVDVEQARAAGDERGADGVERLAVAALRDVGDGEEQLAHRGGRDDPPRRRRVVAERERPALGEGGGAVLRALEHGGGVAVLEVAAAAELGLDGEGGGSGSSATILSACRRGPRTTSRVLSPRG
jgi:hypothetical protein